MATRKELMAQAKRLQEEIRSGVTLAMLQATDDDTTNLEYALDALGECDMRIWSLFPKKVH